MMDLDQAVELKIDSLEFSISSPFSAESDLDTLNRHLEECSVDDLLQWSLTTFGDRVAQVTSFGPTGMVILDRLAKLSPGIRVITLDTQFLFRETYELIEQVQRLYNIRLDIRRPALSPDAQSQAYGPNLWQSNPDQCCRLRKVVSLQDALHGLDAWITGLRRDQSSTRENIPLLAWDKKHNNVKISPLVTWTRSQVWKYIVENNIPYNLLHDQGYASIGCTYCTQPTSYPAGERSGRWQSSGKTECGIHVII